jgi:RNA polymerase sigma factor (sigma-70 family)
MTISATTAWTVADLSALYTANRASLISQARRTLRNDQDATEVVQEAFLKFMLAAPELDSEDRALAYIRTSINNLSLNVIRARGTRPNLIPIDSDTSEERLAEIATENYIPVDASLTAAEDAAIVRQALSLLSPAERAALVMWEMEGRSTQEIAKELGIKESAVRHTVSRARASLRKVLSTLVIDEARGLTALDLLSTSYKKASEIAHKSGRVAMSLVLLVTAFLGFNSMTGTEPIQTVISSPVSENSGAKAEVTTTEEVVTQEVSTKASPAIDLKDAEAELAFYNAQLQSAAVMLETLMFIEERTQGK